MAAIAALGTVPAQAARPRSIAGSSASYTQMRPLLELGLVTRTVECCCSPERNGSIAFKTVDGFCRILP